MDEADNMLKYGNYKEQMGRLKKAMANHFFLESLFIEYVIVEDRTNSILKHAGVYHPKRHRFLGPKLEAIEFLAQDEDSLLHKYITPDLVERVRAWKEQRDRLMHRLLEQELTTDELEGIALEGQECVKLLRNKVNSYNRALERERLKNENGGNI